MSERTKRLELIQKLLEKGSKTTNPNEAAVFMEKASAMMAEAGFTRTDLDRSQIRDTTVKSTQSVSKPKSWEVMVVQTVAKSFGCGVLWQAGDSRYQDYWGRYVLVGNKDYLKLAEYAVVNLLRQAARARADKSRQLSALGPLGRQYKNQVLEGFISGWASTVCDAARRFAVETNTDLEKIVQEVLSEMADGGQTKMRKKFVDGRSYREGLEAGRDVEIQRPMEGGEERLKLR